MSPHKGRLWVNRTPSPKRHSKAVLGDNKGKRPFPFTIPPLNPIPLSTSSHMPITEYNFLISSWPAPAGLFLVYMINNCPNQESPITRLSDFPKRYGVD